MARQKRVEITFDDLVPDLNEVKNVTVELPVNVGIEQRETKEGWSATLTYFDLSCVLRERTEGTIECEGEWIDTKSRRRRTGQHSKAHAIDIASGWLLEAHRERLKAGTDDDGKPRPMPQTLRLSEADRILREKNLLPGAPGSKKQAPYDLALCIARSIWVEDPILRSINKEHVRRFYRARVLPEYWSDVFGEDAPDEIEGFEWAADFADRPRVGKQNGRSKPVTVHNDLNNLRTALEALVGEPSPAGGVYLEDNPLANLNSGNFAKAKREVAGRDRYPLVLRYADKAVADLRVEGRHWEEPRTYTYKGISQWVTYNRKECLDYVPGFLRYLLVLQFGHPTRPRSIRHLKAADCARTRPELVRLIASLDLREDDQSVPRTVTDVWTHGGLAYRRRYSKLQSERLVPFSRDIRIEHDRYTAQRAAWLAARGAESVWLFPSPRDPSKPVSEKDANRLLAYGEEIARQAVRLKGYDADELVPEIAGTAFYAYRHWWKTIRNAIGWTANKNSAYVGDWSQDTGATADVVYARWSPNLVLACVEGKSIIEAIAEDPATDEYKRAARIRPDADDEGAVLV